MPEFSTVSPPYSIINEIARLRESGGAAWGQAAQSVGQSVGQAGEKIGDTMAKQKAQKYHDAMLDADKNYTDHKYIAPVASSDLPARTAPGPMNAKGEFTPGGTPSGPMNIATQQVGEKPKPGDIKLNDHLAKYGLPPTKEGENIWMTPKQQEKEEAAKTIADLKNQLGEKSINEKMNQTHHQVTDAEAAQYPGLKSMANSWIPNDTFKSLVAPTKGKSADADKEANRKIISDYAAKNKVSLDALRPGGMGGWNADNMAMAAQVIKDHPDYSISEAKKEFAGQMSATVRGAGTAAAKASDIKVNLDSAHKAFSDVLDKAADVTKSMDASSIGLVNKALVSGKMELNDPNSVKLYTYMDEASGNYARIKKGGSASTSDQDVAEARKFLTTKLDEGGIKAVKEAVDTEYQGRLKGLPGGDTKKAAQKYSDPVKAKKIADAYKKGPQTKEAYDKAQKQLEALKADGSQ